MRNYLLFFFTILLLSCGNIKHEDYHSFNHQGWNTDTIVRFKYIISNIKNSYNLGLKIRHTVDYEFQNLYLFLEEAKKDTIEIILANKSGKWLGRGISDVREVEYFYTKQRSFIKEGEYKLSVEQAMRYGELNKIENLEHILDIGLIISKNND